MDELIDVYNDKNEPVGIVRKRGEAHREGLWHRAAHVWIYNSAGEILLQLRANKKQLCPNLWDVSSAGHIGAGEEPTTSALREVEEEIGLSLKSAELRFFKIRKHQAVYRNVRDNEFFYIYFVKFDGDIKELTLQKEEVQKVKFFSINELKKELETNPEKFVAYGDYWMDIMKEVEFLVGKN
jgi:isopentenyldiphosphate isomerase